MITGGKELIQDRFEIQMTGTGIPAIGIGNMKMEDMFPALADALLNHWLFDVHVKGIEEQPEVICTNTFDQFQSLFGSC